MGHLHLILLKLQHLVLHYFLVIHLHLLRNKQKNLKYYLLNHHPHLLLEYLQHLILEQKLLHHQQMY
jgi:hypothetical protein